MPERAGGKCDLFVKKVKLLKKLVIFYTLTFVPTFDGGATSFRATQTRQHQCALLTMSSSNFGAEQRIGEPLSALAVLTGPD